MKIFKERRHALINRPVEILGVNYLSLGLMLYFDLTAPDTLHTEQELWQELSPLLGRHCLDQGWPKPHGEVICLGACHAPRGTSVPAALVRLRIGPVDKLLHVFGDRYWLEGPGGLPRMTQARPFARMPLDWEHAFGGKEFKDNPLGRGIEQIQLSDGDTAVPLPNIEGRTLIGAPTDRPEPAGVLPLDVMWPERARKNGTYDETWLKERWPALPDDMNMEFFCVAPEDQFLPGHFAGDEKILITGMHPDMAEIHSRLPTRRVRAFVTRRSTETPEDLARAAFEEVGLKPETLWLFPDVLRGVLLFRGLVRCADDEYSDLARLFTADEDPSQPPKPIEHYRDEQLKKADLTVPFDPAKQQIYQQEMARAAKKVLNLPKMIKQRLSAHQGRNPTMLYSPDDLGRLMDANLTQVRQTIASVEITATDLRGRFGHMVPIDFSIFDRFRARADAMQATSAKLVAMGRKIEQQRDEMVGKTKDILKRPEIQPLIVKGEIDPESILGKSGEPPFHARGFPLLVSWRLNLKLDQDKQRQLRDLGLERETITNRWLAWNPEPLQEQARNWGLEAKPGQETFTIPAGLVLPRFDGPHLVRLLIRPEPLATAREELLVPGSLEEPLFLEAATEQGVVVIVPDELSAAFAEQEVGDFAHVATCSEPGGTLPKPADDALKSGALVVAVLAEQGIWAGLENAFLEALPGCRFALLPEAGGLLRPHHGPKDLRQAVVEQLSPELASRHSLIFDAPGAPKQPGAKKLEDVISADGISSQIRGGYAQGYAAKQATFDARKADLLQRADATKARMAKEGFIPPETLPATAPRSMTEELNARADQVEAIRDRMKSMAALTPEKEAEFNKAIAKMRGIGPQWDAQKSDGMARLKAFQPPSEAQAAFAKAGIDPARFRPQPPEMVAKAMAGEADIKGATLKGLDLSGQDLTGLDLTEVRADACLFKGATLKGARMDGALFQNCDFSGADLSGAILGRTVFKQCVFAQARLREARGDMPVFQTCDLSAADLTLARLNQAIFQKGVCTGLILEQADLRLSVISEADAAGLRANGARFEKCVFKKVSLNKASFVGITTDATLLHTCTGENVTLSGSNLFKFRISHDSAFPGLDLTGVTWKQGYCRKSDLSGADLRGSSLERTIFESCDLTRSNLSKTGLQRCRFLKCSLEAADLRFANLHLASLRKSRLVNADLRGANCYGVDFWRAVLGQTDMEGVNLKRSLLATHEQALQREGLSR
ncbi:Pentapeptide repeat-containing protein [Desulfonatronum zhilinae]|nr:Pentapeptide repeat-containing protein [Desulfonatronum zhilinae]